MSHRLSPLRIFRNIHTSPGGLLKQSKGQSSKQWIERQEKDRFVKSAKVGFDLFQNSSMPKYCNWFCDHISLFMSVTLTFTIMALRIYGTEFIHID